jgi:hypothetical protein
MGRKRSVDFEMSFWCYLFDQKANEIVLSKVSALASK